MIKEKLEEGAKKLKITLSDSMIEKFEIYQKELLEWNKRMSLISSRDESRVVERHFLDSLESIKFIPEGAKILDIGSGAGFPGIPIKIVRNDIHVDLLEPKLKKFTFLNHLVETLELSVGIYEERVEYFSSDNSENRDIYDIIFSRSVGNLKWFTKAVIPILLPDGKIITYKGSRFWDEFNEIYNWKILHREARNFCEGTIVVLKRSKK